MSHEIIMPTLGMAQDTAIIIAWHKQPGDAVRADDVLMEVETDKATVEVEAGHEGYVTELRAEVDVPVPVGKVVAIIAATPDTPPPIDEPEEARDASLIPDAEIKLEQPVPSLPVNDAVLASPKAKYQAYVRGIDLSELVRQGVAEPLHMADLEHQSVTSGVVSASPKVRRLAREKEVDLKALAAKLGRKQLCVDDVVNLHGDPIPPAAPQQVSASASELQPEYTTTSHFWNIDHSQYGPVQKLELTRSEQLASANLSAAHQLIPAVTHHDHVCTEELEKIRADLTEDFINNVDGKDVRLTALSFHAKALSRTLSAFPRFNASLSVDGKNLWLKQYIDVGIAVNTPQGLKVVVVRGCDSKSLYEIAATIDDLATRARTRKIRPDDMGGAGMTISNLGANGPELFTPIINPPEVAILGLSRVLVEPVWNGASFTPVKMSPLSLTYDHRVINGADAVEFLVFYKQQIEKPWKLLV